MVIEFLMLNVIDSLPLIELAFDFIEVFAQTMRADFIDQPVILLLINVIQQFCYVLNARKAGRINSVRHFPILVSREKSATKGHFNPRGGVNT